MVERAVGILKGLLTKAEDPYLALLNYWNSPRADGAPSPTTRMLGRSTRTLLPESMRSVMATYDPDTHAKLKRSKEVQKQYYDIHAKDLQPLEIGKEQVPLDDITA